jgi:hypothetical protein
LHECHCNTQGKYAERGNEHQQQERSSANGLLETQKACTRKDEAGTQVKVSTGQEKKKRRKEGRSEEKRKEEKRREKRREEKRREEKK